jgi:NAD(P)-dependent dehydrogenase (short-subunit alcohol dehydrogenase family)
MDLQLINKTALVTGSTAGIGLAIATSLAAEGATVVVNGRTPKRVQSAIAEIRKSLPDARLIAADADVSNAAGCDKLTAALPRVDILVNNAGIFEVKPFLEIPDDDWERFFQTNVMSGVRLSRFYMPKMLQQDWGRIIFISSESAIQIPVEMIHYGFTKTAQLAVARGLAELTAGTKVTVNSVLPGPTASEGASAFVADLAKSRNVTTEQIEKEFFEHARPTSLLKRFASPAEVANFVTFVASPLSSATNGASLRVDGGVVRSIV